MFGNLSNLGAWVAEAFYKAKLHQEKLTFGIHFNVMYCFFDLNAYGPADNREPAPEVQSCPRHCWVH